MNIRNFTLLLILGAMMVFTGCNTGNFKKKWPKYPDWGWWKHPAGEEIQETTEPEKPVPPQERPDLTKTPEPAKPGFPKTPIRDPKLLTEYRQSVWPETKQLRNLDEIPETQRQEYLAHAIEMLPRWYAPLPVDPPDTNDPDWTTVVIWDFMPEQEFSKAADAYRKIAEQQKVSYPKYITRRELMQFILQLTGGSKPKQELFVPMKPKEGILK